MVKTANLAVKFVLELVAIGTFAYWGAMAGSGALAILLAIAAPTAAIIVWGLFLAPRAKRRLPLPARIPAELVVFGLAAASLAAVGSSIAAIVFGIVVIANAVLLSVFHQWDQ